MKLLSKPAKKRLAFRNQRIEVSTLACQDIGQYLAGCIITVLESRQAVCGPEASPYAKIRVEVKRGRF